MIFKRRNKGQVFVKNRMRTPTQPVENITTPKGRIKNSKSAKDFGFLRGVQNVMDGTILTREIVIRLLPFILFITILGLIYISNSYYAQKTIKEIDKGTSEMKELQYEYITSKSVLMFYSSQSEVAKRLRETAVKESVEPPQKIFTQQSSKK